MVTIQQFEHSELQLVGFETFTRYLGRPLLALFFKKYPTVGYRHEEDFHLSRFCLSFYQ